MSTPAKQYNSQSKRFRNIGPVSARLLEAVGVQTRDDLERIGPVNIYKQLKLNGFNPSLNIVYALQGAILDCDWRELPEFTQKRLKAEVRAFHFGHNLL